ncbi:MAG: DNA-processing protein DprA [Candidatus Moranbacteria bacterium]|nr:DNA-processing protein DprA [Candidatus Moranbacteria bacterium]
MRIWFIRTLREFISHISMKYFNALNKIDGLGRKGLKMLANHFENSQQIWQASHALLVAAGVRKDVADKVVAARPLIDPEIEWEKVQQENIVVATINDPEYPSLLKQIPDNPYLIYMKGDLSCLDLPMVAMVGSRKLTEYGNQVARGFAKELAASGICVVSGLAFGIDAMSHRGALEGGGKTIAVLGNSLDSVSIAPRSNFQLSEEILKAGGLLISEFPIRTNADKWTFPARNRLMAGMSSGTLVVEAAEKSGSLITANLALDYNREVFAVPGSIFSPQSVATHQLIKSGAKLVTCVKDVLEELKFDQPSFASQPKQKTPNFELSKSEQEIYDCLTHESLHIDRIGKLTKLDTATISSILAILEIKGAVKNIGGQNYIRL